MDALLNLALLFTAQAFINFTQITIQWESLPLPYPPGECTRDSHCPDKKKCCDGGCIFYCVDV
uniref:WAP domain-containing protein n=1 Tax=Leptobrachium leishanense TaxID=445787 RepID=A0A8C5QCX8_9ANUR